MEPSAESTSKSTAGVDRKSDPPKRCFMLVMRGVRTPTKIVQLLHARGIEVLSVATPVELFVEYALAHITRRFGDRVGRVDMGGRGGRDNSSSNHKQTSLLVIIIEPDHDPDTKTLTDALRKYFPAIVMWSYQRDRQPQLRRMTEPHSINDDEDPQVQSETQAQAPRENAVPVSPQPQPTQSKLHPETISGNDIEAEDDNTPRTIRFEDIVRASKVQSGNGVSIHESHHHQIEPAPRVEEDNDDSCDPIFEPPRFSTIDEFGNEEIKQTGDEPTAIPTENTEPPGFVTEEELAMLLDDGDLLFSDAEDNSQ